ncbi:hypothetical protein IE077_000010 [Cardiosporidium cionae]|uniref:Uncharacterized protein n=1 Tax=Cardiosporidium cionae TaxID=476202 RepID=A0ABQ7JF10_9APIC|nr:hypothetical protein IE077_000010 [Cardiosporidium cionae]|eukprot:KAF8822235.1 hypothetical protein IE077_000010 [Cardiosporidium cionae]
MHSKTMNFGRNIRMAKLPGCSLSSNIRLFYWRKEKTFALTHAHLIARETLSSYASENQPGYPKTISFAFKNAPLHTLNNTQLVDILHFAADTRYCDNNFWRHAGRRAASLLPVFSPREMNILLTSFATVGKKDRDLFEKASSRIASVIHAYSINLVCSCLAAFGRLKLREECFHLCEAISNHLQTKVPILSEDTLLNLVQVYAELKIADFSLLGYLAAIIEEDKIELKRENVVKLVSLMADLEYRRESLFDLITKWITSDDARQKLLLDDYAVLLDAYGTLQFRSKLLLAHATAALGSATFPNCNEKHTNSEELRNATSVAKYWKDQSTLQAVSRSLKEKMKVKTVTRYIDAFAKHGLCEAEALRNLLPFVMDCLPKLSCTCLVLFAALLEMTGIHFYVIWKALSEWIIFSISDLKGNALIRLCLTLKKHLETMVTAYEQIFDDTSDKCINFFGGDSGGIEVMFAREMQDHFNYITSRLSISEEENFMYRTQESRSHFDTDISSSYAMLLIEAIVIALIESIDSFMIESELNLLAKTICEIFVWRDKFLSAKYPWVKQQNSSNTFSGNKSSSIKEEELLILLGSKLVFERTKRFTSTRQLKNELPNSQDFSASHDPTASRNVSTDLFLGILTGCENLHFDQKSDSQKYNVFNDSVTEKFSVNPDILIDINSMQDCDGGLLIQHFGATKVELLNKMYKMWLQQISIPMKFHGNVKVK